MDSDVWQQSASVKVADVPAQHNNHQQDDLPLIVLGKLAGMHRQHLHSHELKQETGSPAAEGGSIQLSSVALGSDQELVVYDSSPHRPDVSGPHTGHHHSHREAPEYAARCTSQQQLQSQTRTFRAHGDSSTLVAQSHQQQHNTQCSAACHPVGLQRHTSQCSSQPASVTPLKESAMASQGLSPLNPKWQQSPAFSCASMPSPQHPYAVPPTAHSTSSFSTQSLGSCNGLGLPHVVKKYKRAKALLQAHLHEVQRLKAVAATEAQKAAAAAEQARTLEGQLAASTAAVVEVRLGQQDLQQKVGTSCSAACTGAALYSTAHDCSCAQCLTCAIIQAIDACSHPLIVSSAAAWP